MKHVLWVLAFLAGATRAVAVTPRPDPAPPALANIHWALAGLPATPSLSPRTKSSTDSAGKTPSCLSWAPSTRPTS